MNKSDFRLRVPPLPAHSDFGLGSGINTTVVSRRIASFPFWRAHIRTKYCTGVPVMHTRTAGAAPFSNCVEEALATKI